jgi:hypothetical protein
MYLDGNNIYKYAFTNTILPFPLASALALASRIINYTKTHNILR